jgi:MYXO-CTERM domain-containing protein
VVVLTSLVFAVSCSGGGCGGCAAFEPIPGGFPAAERTPNAVQVRVSQSGIAAITADPAKLITAIAGGMNGVLSFNAPVNCSGSTPTCCPGGNPKDPCGPIDVDFNLFPGDLPRLEVRPAQGANRVDLTVRARIKTVTDIPVKVPVVGDCGVRIDTAAGTVDDIRIDAPINFQQDATSGTTRVVVGDVALTQLATEDVSLTGGIGCALANLGLSFFIDILEDQLTGVIQETIQDQTCKACPSGDVGECGTFATACTNEVCMQGTQCMQELGLAGRARGTSLFGSFSPGTTGAIDLYEVAGGYATSNTNGLALGLLGGMLPGGAPRDRCGPPAAAAPAKAAIPVSPFFQDNTRPDNDQPFGVGIGIHKSQLEQFAYAGYEGGLLCLTVNNDTVQQLSTDTLALVSRSLGKLVEGNAPMAVGLRPQSPPQLTLGKNVFTDDGQGNVTLTEPLIDIRFAGMEIDFFASIDDQYARVFTVVSDVHLPLGLQVTAMGELAPVLGNTDNAFTNISVKNSEAVTESPAELAALFPTVLNLVLPQLSGGLPAIALPAIGGLQLDVSAVTGVPVSPGGADVSFLAIYADLTPAALAPAVATTISLGEITEPDPALVSDPTRWRGAAPPAVTLDLGGDAEDLEFSYRVDGGAWSAWSRNPRPTLSPGVFWLPGTHRVEARARQLGKPGTIDPTPASIEVTLGARANVRRSGVRGFHGQPGEAGCNCATGGSATDAAPLALVLGVVLLPLRRVRRRLARIARDARRLGAVAWLAAIAMLPGCSCGADYCGDVECLDGDLAGGGIGRFTSIAADDERVLVATYDHGLGDLVVVDVTDPANPKKLAVDGIPLDATPTYAAGTYRGGIEEPGPDVGAWTSIAISDGKAKVAYQDRDAGALKYAFETKPGQWEKLVVDDGGGAEAGRYASLVIDADGRPAIAYLALGLDDGTGQRVTELRIARGGVREPDAGDWSSHLAAAAAGSCAGLCGGGEACVVDAASGAEACKAVAATCASACGDGDACIDGACTATIATPTAATLASGTGLFVSLVVLPDGRLAAAYYDRVARALKLAVESAAGSNEFAETELHGGAAGDRGMWASAVVDDAGTIHIAYQDAIGDQLLYTTWNSTAGAPEVVDDGQRAGDRTHPVGAGASIYLVGGAPAIAYQDGLTSDVYVATRGAASWTAAALSSGPLLDGISIGAAVGPGGVPYLAWDRLDPALSPPHTLAVENP